MSRVASFTAYAAGVLALGMSASAAIADPVEDFYKGKQMAVIIGAGAGGGYDLYGRLVARHMGKHIPGKPTIVPQNMPGAGSLRAANYLYEIAPKDGTHLGSITQTVALEEALGTPGVRFKAADFTWIGRLASNVEVQLTSDRSKAKTIQDAMTNEIPVAGTGPGLASVVYPTVLNNVLGTKFKVITGYTGSTDAMLAVERGEVEGALNSWSTIKTSHRALYDEKKINILVQYTLEKHADLPNVPTVVELAKTPEEKQILSLYASGAVVGRSIMSTPKVPAERVKALRTAFQAMVKDKDFLAEVEKTKSDFDPMTGEELEKLIVESGKMTDSVRDKARAARGL
jgi:tripartite-type tricarboxylate transporter receptor subunit TctC